MHINELIGDQYMTWRPGERILIAAGCGTGKTTFAVGPLLEWAQSQGKSIIYMSSRKALNHSLVRRYTKRGIIFTTYQRVEQELLDGKRPLAGYDIVVCDESHYFVSDSTFNSRTEESWRAVVMSKATVIFMTGTPEGIRTLAEIAGIALREYDLPAQTDHIRRVVWSSSRQQYIDSIVRTAKQGRPLMAFFASKADMHRCEGRLAEAKISCEVYDSTGRTAQKTADGQTVLIPKLPAQDELGYTLSAQCLLSTTYLNSGIEVWDSGVTDVFSDIIDIDECIQSLYRKRCRPGERVTLHVRCYSSAELARNTADERAALVKARTYRRVRDGDAAPEEAFRWEPGWEKSTRILRLAHTPVGQEYVEVANTALAHAMRSSAIFDAVSAGVSYRSLITDALGLSGTDRQADEMDDRLEDAKRWLEMRIGHAINTDDLSQILAVRSNGHSGYVKNPTALDSIIKPLGYTIRFKRIKGKRIRVLAKVQEGAAS